MRGPPAPTFVSLVVACIAAACTVGPDFVAPAPPAVNRFTEAPLGDRTNPGATGQTLVAARDIPGEWWRLFNCPALDALEHDATEANPNLEAAQATLRSAQETALAQAGALYRQINGQLGYSRQSLSVAQTGGVRSRANLYNLAGIQEASFRAQIAATEAILAILAILQQQLVVVRAQLESGSASVADVLTQQTTLAQVQATLPPPRQQLQLQRDLLAILTGRLPAQRVAQRFGLAGLVLPADLPVSLPSRLVEQRPDVGRAPS